MMATQKATLLRLLNENGSRGVSVHQLIYVHGITRAAAIVHDLKKEGLEIVTIDEGDSKLARYVLKAAIRPPAAPCECGDQKSGHVGGEFKCMAYRVDHYCDCERYRAA